MRRGQTWSATRSQSAAPAEENPTQAERQRHPWQPMRAVACNTEAHLRAATPEARIALQAVVPPRCQQLRAPAARVCSGQKKGARKYHTAGRGQHLNSVAALN